MKWFFYGNYNIFYYITTKEFNDEFMANINLISTKWKIKFSSHEFTIYKPQGLPKLFIK